MCSFYVHSSCLHDAAVMHRNYCGSFASSKSSNADVTERSPHSSENFRSGEADAVLPRYDNQRGRRGLQAAVRTHVQLPDFPFHQREPPRGPTDRMFVQKTVHAMLLEPRVGSVSWRRIIIYFQPLYILFFTYQINHTIACVNKFHVVVYILYHIYYLQRNIR